MSHTSDKVSVGGRYRDLVCSEYSHISAKARSAGRCGYNAARIYKGIDISKSYTVLIYLLCCRDHDISHTLGDMSSLEYLSSCLHIRKSAVCTRSDNYLVGCDVCKLSCIGCVLREVRTSNSRLDSREIFNGGKANDKQRNCS